MGTSRVGRVDERFELDGQTHRIESRDDLHDIYHCVRESDGIQRQVAAEDVDDRGTWPDVDGRE